MTSLSAAPAPRSHAAVEHGTRKRWRVGAAALAGVLVLAALVHFGVGARGLIGAFLAAVLVLLSVIDLEERRLPNRIVLPSTAVVLAAQLAFHPDRAVEWIVAALAAALFLFVPLLAYPSGMGMGDVKLALLLGAALGKAVAFALVVGIFAGGAAALVLLAARGRGEGRRMIPYGPFLAFGALAALFLGDPLDLI